VAGEIGTGANSMDQLRVPLMATLTDSLLAMAVGFATRAGAGPVRLVGRGWHHQGARQPEEGPL